MISHFLEGGDVKGTSSIPVNLVVGELFAGRWKLRVMIGYDCTYYESGKSLSRRAEG